MESCLRQTLALPPDLRVAALGEALIVCAEEEAEPIALGLIALAVGEPGARGWKNRIADWLSVNGRVSRRDAALAALAGAWGRVPASLRAPALAAGRGRWEGVVERVVTDGNPSRRLGVAQLARDSCDAGLAACAAAMLTDPDNRVSEAAEESLVAIAIRAVVAGGTLPEGVLAIQDESPAWADPGAIDALAGVMAAAAGSFEEHRKRGAVLAALTMYSDASGPGMDALRAWVTRCAAEKGGGAISGALRWAKTPVARLRALQWLGHDGLRGAACERLGRSAGVVEHELVLGAWHLGLRPARRQRLADVAVGARDGRSAALPGAGAMAMLSERARRGAIGMAGLMRAEIAVRRGLVDAALGDASAVVRHAAVRSAPLGALTDWCFDPDARVARSAFVRWSRGQGAGRGETVGLLATLRRSGDSLVRGWAERERGMIGGGVFDIIGLRRQRKTDPAAWEGVMRAALGSGEDETVLAALLAARALGESDRFAEEVLRLASGAGGSRVGERIAATAMAMTAGVSGAQRKQAHAVQVRGLVHANRRVRANAVESLMRAGAGLGVPSAAHALMELKDDPDHRVRANALRAGLCEPALAGRAESGLIKMLNDSRDMHRLAGAWLVGRVGRLGERAGVERCVRELAERDAHHGVRARALATVLRMDAAGGGHGRLRLVRDGADTQASDLREVA